jgi:pimeloyl-ACP methyl ester carboxylesterase
MTLGRATRHEAKNAVAPSDEMSTGPAEMPDKKTTFVLTPGAWHGGWVWHPVARRLRAAGNAVVTLTMPGLTDGDDRRGLRLQDAVDYIIGEVNLCDLEDVTLVAHSWGGFPMTGAAPELAGRVSKVIYYNAMVPLPGRSALDDLPPGFASAVRAAIASSSDGSAAVPLEVVQQLLMQDQPERLQRLVWELLVPQPGNYGEDVLEARPVSSLGIPIVYILSENDLGFGYPEAGLMFADRLGVEPISVPGSHESLLTHPDDVAQALIDAVRGR